MSLALIPTFLLLTRVHTTRLAQPSELLLCDPIVSMRDCPTAATITHLYGTAATRWCGGGRAWAQVKPQSCETTSPMVTVQQYLHATRW